jgi:hypothetical protein
VSALSKPLAAAYAASALSVPWNEQTLNAFAKQGEQAERAYQARTFDYDFSKTPQGRQLALLDAQVDEMRMLREEARCDREAAKRDRLWGMAIGVAGVLVGAASALVAVIALVR